MTEQETSFDFAALAEYADAEQSSPQRADSLQNLLALARKAAELDSEVAIAEAKLKTTKEALTELTEKQIPGLMAELNLVEFRQPECFIGIKNTVHAKISKDRTPAAVEWLDEHGLAGMVKRIVTISFNREEQKLARKLMADIARRKTPLRVAEEQWVEPQTLKAWVTRQLAAEAEAEKEGREVDNVPRDIFGVFERKIAVVEIK